MGRFAVVLPLEPLAAGDGFPVSAWPLHVTVVEPFETRHDAAWVAELLGPVLHGRSTIATLAFDRAMFGPKRDVPVTLVRDDGPLGAMRTRLLRALVTLLDDVIPVMPGCEINDDPLQPICSSCRAQVAEAGDRTPIGWLDPRSSR